MNDDELGRLLSGAFDAQARGAVGDDRVPPPPLFAEPPAASAGEELPLGLVRPSRARRWPARIALPLSAAAAVIVLVGLVLMLVEHGSGKGNGRHQAAASNVAKPPPPRALQGSGAPVHIRLFNSDGSVVGVGMPVIAYFSKPITDARALQDVTTVTVDGKPTTAAWYFERSAAMKGYPYEAHLRPADYWPANSAIHVAIQTDGLTAGKGLRYNDSLTLDFRTGARHVLTVNAATHRLTLNSNGKQLTYPVSLGAIDTPTHRGVKVVMAKGASVCMTGPGYHRCGIKYTERLTNDGEYLHAAPWNVHNIKMGIDSSDGSTNLRTAAARTLFHLLRVGDVVQYPNANGPAMQLGNGFGDWNVSWKLWLTGGLVRTH